MLYKSHSVRCYTKLQFLLNIVQKSLEILYKARVVEIDCDIFSQQYLTSDYVNPDTAEKLHPNTGLKI